MDRAQQIMAITEEARSWVGTPYIAYGRKKGLAADCFGFIGGVARNLNLTTFDTTEYRLDPISPDYSLLTRSLEEHMDPVPLEDASPGDVVLIRLFAHPRHLGILVPRPGRLDIMNLIHAHGRAPQKGSPYAGAVVEHIYDNTWSGRTVGAYRFRWPA